MKYLKACIGIIILVGLDQISKYLVLQNLELYEYHPILGNLFGLYYLENEGMAWGMFQNRQIVFLILTVLVIGAVGWSYVKLSQDAKFRSLNLCILFLIAGAIGNMIDRIFHGDILFQGAVVDFLYIKCIDFPVFNLADMYVTFSIVILACLILFRYKEEDFEAVFRQKSKASVTEEHAVIPTVTSDSESDTVTEPSGERKNAM